VINILVVDDHPLVREGIKLRFCCRPEWMICGETDNTADGLELARKLEPDLAIVDLSLKGRIPYIRPTVDVPFDRSQV
jgi:DNA-binding NarL/FixJ family response regulator